MTASKPSLIFFENVLLAAHVGVDMENSLPFAFGIMGGRLASRQFPVTLGNYCLFGEVRVSSSLPIQAEFSIQNERGELIAQTEGRFVSSQGESDFFKIRFPQIVFKDAGQYLVKFRPVGSKDWIDVKRLSLQKAEVAPRSMPPEALKKWHEFLQAGKPHRDSTDKTS